MFLHFQWLHLLVSIICLTGAHLSKNKLTATNGKVIQDLVAKFEKGDPGWRVRMQALVQTTMAGGDAVPLLAESLETGVPSVREFAAHALSIIADPRSEPALTKALDDEDRGVRIYAVRALSALGKLRLTDDYRTAMGAGAWPKAPWMEDYLLAAENPQRLPNTSAKRKALLGYDLSKMDTARLGHLAPDFALEDRDGNEVHLTDFRDKVAIVLEFNDGRG